MIIDFLNCPLKVDADVVCKNLSVFLKSLKPFLSCSISLEVCSFEVPAENPKCAALVATSS